MPKWWRPVTLGSAGVGCVVVSGVRGGEGPPAEGREEGPRRTRRMKGGGVVVGSPWRLAGTTLSVAEATRVGPALGIYSVSRVNPIFVDEDFTPANLGHRSHYPNVFQNAAPESPGKSGSSGYESNPCSDEFPSTRRGDPRHPRSSAPRRAGASRAARRQACSVHRQTIRQGTADGRGHEGDSDEGYARIPLAPIPEGRVGAPYRALGAGDAGSLRGACGESAGDSPASYSPASTASSSPASSSSSSSGKRLLKRADAAILLWGQGPSRGGSAPSTAAAAGPVVGGHGLLRDALKAPSCPSPMSSAPSTVSSGASLPPHRGTVLPEAEGGVSDGRDPGSGDPVIAAPSNVPPPEEPPNCDRSLPYNSAAAEDLAVARCCSPHPSKQQPSRPEAPWGGFLFPPQFVRRGMDAEEGGMPNALKNAMLYGTLYRIKSGVDAYEKLKALERDGPPPSREDEGVAEHSGEVGRVGSWGDRWDFAGGPVLVKEGGASGRLQAPHSPVPSIASSHGKQFTGHGHADFTLDMPRAERLMRQIAAAKRRRCWGRFLATTFALVFFFISVVAVSMLCTRGKRVFGPL